MDDEQLLVKGIKFNLENDGYEVLTADKNAAARKEIARRGVFGAVCRKQQRVFAFSEKMPQKGMQGGGAVFRA